MDQAPRPYIQVRAVFFQMSAYEDSQENPDTQGATMQLSYPNYINSEHDQNAAGDGSH